MAFPRILRSTSFVDNLVLLLESRLVFIPETGGLTNGGLSPKFLEKIGQKSFRENRAFSGLIGAFSGPIGAFSGLIGTDSSAPHSRGEAAKVPPKGPFWAQLAPFGLSPRLLSPRLDFPIRAFSPQMPFVRWSWLLTKDKLRLKPKQSFSRAMLEIPAWNLGGRNGSPPLPDDKIDMHVLPHWMLTIGSPQCQINPWLIGYSPHLHFV